MANHQAVGLLDPTYNQQSNAAPSTPAATAPSFQANSPAQPPAAPTAPKAYEPPEYDSKGLLEASVNDINTLTSGNSPLLRGADTRAKQFENDRGMLNSSMTAGAMEASRLDTVMPLVQQNAQTRGQSYVQDRQNEFQASESGLERGLRTSLQDSEIAARFGLSEQEYLQQFQLAEQSNEFVTARDKVLNDFQASESALGRDQETSLQDSEIAARIGISEQEYQQQSLLADQANNFTQQRDEILNQYQTSESALDRTQQTDIQKTQNDTQILLQQMDQDSRKELIGLEQKWNRTIQGDVNAAAFWQSSIDGLMDIFNNADSTPEQQKIARDEMLGYTLDGVYYPGTIGAGLDFMQRLSGSDDIVGVRSGGSAADGGEPQSTDQDARKTYTLTSQDWKKLAVSQMLESESITPWEVNYANQEPNNLRTFRIVEEARAKINREAKKLEESSSNGEYISTAREWNSIINQSTYTYGD